jgi:hypothetical protein
MKNRDLSHIIEERKAKKARQREFSELIEEHRRQRAAEAKASKASRGGE